MKLGVFDSGIGGEAIAESIRNAFPNAEILTVNDKAHLPYGSRSAKEVVTLTDAAIQPLLNARCDIIVIACNTATAAGIEVLRERYPDQKFIGLEPMVKPAAALTKTGTICICATPTTLASRRYRDLKSKFASEVTVIEPDCSDWASLIEENRINEKHIADIVEDACQNGADVIVLACTHYHWIRQQIEAAARGRATVIHPSEAIVRRVRSLLEIS